MVLSDDGCRIVLQCFGKKMTLRSNPRAVGGVWETDYDAGNGN
jgi:hypothetical protein